jgi:3'-5' exoribonuclease
MDLTDIAELRSLAAGGRAEARVHCQVEAVRQKETRDGKPYFELCANDASGRLTLRAWSDTPAFDLCARLRAGDSIEVAGEFTANSFGIDSRRWHCRPLEPEERKALLAGPEALREKQAADFAAILAAVGEIRDPRLRALADLFLSEHGDRFRRTAAARTYHHARRGGLVEHVAQMIRLAGAICGVFPGLNRDLLVAGALLHDSGKLWENSLPEDGFAMPFDERGELLGHISIGIELANALWRKLPLADWQHLEPATEDVRLHLLHLIAAHHGGNEFGSPVDPKTPEAWALHHIDNLDAKLEMIFSGYGQSAQLAPRIFERVRPLPGNLVLPLARFDPPADPGPPPAISG